MATRTWLGAAVAIPEVYTISITLTWATGDTLTVTINGKDLTLTVGAAATIDDIGAAMVAMINGDSAVGTETRSALGSAVGEFAKLTASYDSTNDDLLITGQSSGRPIALTSAPLTVSSTTAGDGLAAVDGSAASTSGTGPNDLDNADNWSDDTAPVNADDVVFDHQAAASCLHNISKTSLTIANLTVTSGFKYSIGLDAINKHSTSLPYDEHLTTYLSLAAATVMDIDGSGAGIIKIHCGNTDTTATVKGSGTRTNASVPPILLNINNSGADLNVLGGDVGLCFEATTTGEVATFTCAGSNSSKLTIGPSVTIATGTVASGAVDCQSSITTVYVDGGTFTLKQAATITSLYVNGGTFIDISTGTLTSVFATGGMYDRSNDNRAKTITNFTVYARCTIKDPTGSLTVTYGFDIYPALQDVKLDFPKRKTYTLSAI